MAVARKQVEDGAMIVDVNMDEGMLDGKAAMTKFLRIAARKGQKLIHQALHFLHIVHQSGCLVGFFHQGQAQFHPRQRAAQVMADT